MVTYHAAMLCRLHSHRLYDADTEAEIVREWEAFLIRVTS